MKNAITLACLLFLSTVLFAQDADGRGFGDSDVYLTGAVSFYSTSSGDSDGMSVFVSPGFGKFVSDHVSVEGAVIVGYADGVSLEGFPTFNTAKMRSYGVSIAPQYFFSAAKAFSFSVGARVRFQQDRYDNEVEDDLEINTVGLAVVPGMNYFVSDRFAFRASLGALSYFTSKADMEGSEALNQFDFSLNPAEAGSIGVLFKI